MEDLLNLKAPQFDGLGHLTYITRTGTINMGCPDHKWVEVESLEYFARYCYRCKSVEEYADEVWTPTQRRLFG